MRLNLIRIYFLVTAVFFSNIQLVCCFEQRIRQGYASLTCESISFEQPTVELSAENKSESSLWPLSNEISVKPSPEPLADNHNFSLEKRIFKPLSSGWQDVMEKPPGENNNFKGIEQLINIVENLFNRMSSASAVPLNMAATAAGDTINAYMLGEKESSWLITKMVPFDKLLDTLFHIPSKNSIDMNLSPNLNMLIKLYI